LPLAPSEVEFKWKTSDGAKGKELMLRLITPNHALP